jgi:hypothetical protein
MIDPRNLSLQQWADATILSLNSGWPFGRYTGGDWRDYLVSFVRAPPMAQRVLPDPHKFSDWREWAMRAAPMIEDAD